MAAVAVVTLEYFGSAAPPPPWIEASWRHGQLLWRRGLAPWRATREEADKR